MKVCAASLLVCLLISACNQPQTHQHSILAFGTSIDISIVHKNHELAQQAFQRLDEDFNKMHEIWHPWRNNALKRTNQLLKTGGWFTASTSILPLLQRSKNLAIQSHHYFNPGIGKLVKLWGFHRDNPEQPFIPDMLKIQKLQSDIPNMQHIEFDGIRMRGTHPAIQFDSGGIAKGYALGLAMQTLRSMGIDNALINAGGDLSTIGQHLHHPWRIGIQHPRGERPLGSIKTTASENIFSSGDYQRFYTLNNKRIQHILDPIKGIPTAHTFAATVIHTDPVTADAAATALVAAGEQHWKKVARGLGITEALILTANHKLLISSAMSRRIKLHHVDSLRIEIHDL